MASVDITLDLKNSLLKAWESVYWQQVEVWVNQFVNVIETDVQTKCLLEGLDRSDLRRSPVHGYRRVSAQCKNTWAASHLVEACQKSGRPQKVGKPLSQWLRGLLVERKKAGPGCTAVASAPRENFSLLYFKQHSRSGSFIRIFLGGEVLPIDI